MCYGPECCIYLFIVNTTWILTSSLPRRHYSLCTNEPFLLSPERLNLCLKGCALSDSNSYNEQKIVSVFFWKDPPGVEGSDNSLLWILCICQCHFIAIYFPLLPQRQHATSAWKLFDIEFIPLGCTVMQITFQFTKTSFSIQNHKNCFYIYLLGF